MPGVDHGVRIEDPTIGELLKNYGYHTGQFGPRGVLDCVASDKDDKTVEPRWGKVGKQVCKDTGPLTIARMKTIEKEDITPQAIKWMEEVVARNKASDEDEPFFMWFNSTRGHVWVHLSDEQYHKTGKGVFPDAMDELDWEVGQILDKLDELGIADNTIRQDQLRGPLAIGLWPKPFLLFGAQE